LKDSLKDVPAKQAGRIKWVAELLYPLGRWRARIAADLGIGRSTLYRRLRGRKRTARGIDDALLMVMARERSASHRRAREITEAEKAFSEEMGRTATAKDVK